MGLRKIFLGVLCAASFSLGGCHGLWKETRDNLIGTKFNQNLSHNETGNIYSYGFRGMSKLPKSGTYKVEDEGSSKRYFIRYSEHCSYSLLVTPGGTILSWRFESLPDRCVVF